MAASVAPATNPGAPPRDHASDALIKQLEIQKWYSQLGDAAEVNEVRYTSAPPHKP
jgi:hypothetical protein